MSPNVIILRLKCTKFDFRGAPRSDHTLDAYSSLPPLSVFKGLLLRGGRWAGKRKGRRMGREREGKKKGKE